MAESGPDHDWNLTNENSVLLVDILFFFDFAHARVPVLVSICYFVDFYSAVELRLVGNASDSGHMRPNGKIELVNFSLSWVLVDCRVSKDYLIGSVMVIHGVILLSIVHRLGLELFDDLLDGELDKSLK